MSSTWNEVELTDVIAPEFASFEGRTAMGEPGEARIALLIAFAVAVLCFTWVVFAGRFILD